MDVKKFDYTDLIDMDCKNQTAKLLENYFHIGNCETRGARS